MENGVRQRSGGKDGEAGKRTKKNHITSPGLSEGLFGQPCALSVS